MKKVLIITYYWPPSGGSGVQRWVKFARYLPSCGWEPVVYTPENPELIAVDSRLGEEVAGVEVVKKKIFEPYNIYRCIFGRRKTTKGGGVNPINSQKKSLAGRLALWIRGNFFVPDPRCLWVGPSVRFLKKYLQEHPVDAIVSTGPPHSMHLIARKVARATGIPWVADFRDPWTKMFYFKHLPLMPCALRKHLRLEKMVLDEASAVVAVSPIVRDDFRGMTSTRVELITNGFDEGDFREIATSAAERPPRNDVKGDVEDGGKNDVENAGSHDGRNEVRNVGGNDGFRVVHTGLFAADGNPTTLWKVLADLCAGDADFRAALRIRMAGRTDVEVLEAVRGAGLGDGLEDLGYLAHGEAVAEQCGAGLLILPLRKEPEYRAVLPGKVFEYMASGRPILGIGQSDGAMAMILKECGAGVVCEWDDAEGMAAAVGRAWTAWKEEILRRPSGFPQNDVVGGLAMTCSKRRNDIMKYSRRNLTKSMAALLEEISKKYSEGAAEEIPTSLRSSE